MTKVEVKKVLELRGHSGAIFALENGFEKNSILSGGADKIVSGWDLKAQTPASPTLRFETPVYSICRISGKFLAAGTGTGNVHIIDLEEKIEIRNLKIHNAPVFSLAFNERNGKLFSGAADGTFSRSDLREGIDWIKKTGDGKIRKIAVSEKFIAVPCGDGNITLFDPSGDYELEKFPAHKLSANSVRFHPKKNILVSGGKDAYLKFWALENGVKLIDSVPAHNYAIYDIVFSPDAMLMATASLDKTLKLWDADNFDFLLRINKEKLNGHAYSVNTLLWNDHFLFSAGDDRSIMGWEIRSEL